MANNPYVNKVQKADGTTIIDISDTTATASDVASGKYFYLASGQRVQGSGSSGGFVSQDANGYIVVSPTADLPVLKTKSITANGTYNASTDNASGYSSVNVSVPGPTLISKSISTNGTYTASSDSADGYSSVSVNVQSSFTVGTATATGSDTYNYGTITFTVQAQPKAFRVILDVVGYNPYTGGYIESPHGTSIYYTYDGSSYGHVTEIFYDGTNVSMLAEINGSWHYALIPTFTYDSYGNTKYLTIDTRQSYPDYPQWYPQFIRGLTYELTYLY